MWRFLLLLAACEAGIGINNKDDLSATPPDLAGVDFSGVDFSRIDMATAALPDLRGGDFALPDLSGSDLISSDLAGSRPDFAGHDLNLTPFCAGTLVTGTCVEAFFAPLSLCFQPTGACTVQTPGINGTFCWPGGAGYQQRNDPDALRRQYLWETNLCYSEIVGGSGPSPAFTNASGDVLIFAPATGYYTCPDGSKGSIGTNYGGCAQLQQMIAPDTTSCTPGVCP
jgi:hypothetical protein